MTVTCTGAEFNAFMNDQSVWQDGYWLDDVGCEVNGQPDDLCYTFLGTDSIPADATVTVQGGEYHIAEGVGSTFYSFETVLQTWLKARTTTTLVVEVENHAIHDFNILINSFRDATQKPLATIVE